MTFLTPWLLSAYSVNNFLFSWICTPVRGGEGGGEGEGGGGGGGGVGEGGRAWKGERKRRGRRKR